MLGARLHYPLYTFRAAVLCREAYHELREQVAPATNLSPLET
jgi:hypothetical protein